MKYNANYHQYVILNLRRGFKERFNGDELTLLSDEQIWDIYNEWCLVESDDPNDKEEPIYFALNVAFIEARRNKG